MEIEDVDTSKYSNKRCIERLVFSHHFFTANSYTFKSVRTPRVSSYLVD